LDGFLERLWRDVGEIFADFLGRSVIDLSAGETLPAGNPHPAKTAVSIKDEKWLLH